MKKRICVLLAPGYEEVEALTPVDFFRRVGYQVDIVSTIEDVAVRSAHDVLIQADTFLEDIRPEDYILAVIPGGLPGATNLAADPAVIAFMQAVYRQDGYVAAICAGPQVLDEAGLLVNRHMTCYPGYEVHLSRYGTYEALPCVQDGRVITGRGPGASAYFALKLVEAVAGEEAAATLKKETIMDRVESWVRTDHE